MRSTVNVHLIGVWFCVGAGWAVAVLLVGPVLSVI
jgi:hypothetical protein